MTFSRSVQHTMEHGHGNGRGDSFYGRRCWYQAETYTESGTLATIAGRIPKATAPTKLDIRRGAAAVCANQRLAAGPPK